MDTQVMALQGGKHWNRHISQDFLVINVRNPNSKGLKHKANKKKAFIGSLDSGVMASGTVGSRYSLA